MDQTSSVKTAAGGGRRVAALHLLAPCLWSFSSGVSGAYELRTLQASNPSFLLHYSWVTSSAFDFQFINIKSLAKKAFIARINLFNPLAYRKRKPIQRKVRVYFLKFYTVSFLDSFQVSIQAPKSIGLLGVWCNTDHPSFTDSFSASICQSFQLPRF